MRLRYWICLWLGMTAALAAQGTARLVSEFLAARQQLEAEQAALDSLSALLEAQAARIDAEKKKTPGDDGRIRRLMARGLTLSREVDARRDRIATLSESLAVQKYRLGERYAALIDSLQQQAQSADTDEERRRLGEAIVAYSGKYILFSPAFQALRFDPDKLRRIDPAQARDSLERRIAIDYLEKARKDIGTHLSDIRKSRRELERTVRLEEKTRDFLEEVDDGFIGLVTRTPAASGDANRAFTTNETEIGDPIAADAPDPLGSILLFINQLNLPQSGTWRPASDASPQISLQDYLKLLQEAEKRLLQFDKLISGKLSRAGVER